MRVIIYIWPDTVIDQIVVAIFIREVERWKADLREIPIDSMLIAHGQREFARIGIHNFRLSSKAVCYYVSRDGNVANELTISLNYRVDDRLRKK